MKYRRVPGLLLAGGRSTLRVADDHLLLCDYRTRFTERYKRFYFSDIEAVIIRKTIHWIVWMVVWGFVAFCLFLVGLFVGWNKTLFIIEGVLIFFVLIQAMRGPSCRTHIQTAVQVDVLPMLRYVRRATRVIATISSLIEQVQGKRGEIAPSLAKISIRPESPAAAAVVSSSSPVPSLAQASGGRHELSLLHVVTFALVLLTGLNAIWEVNFPSTISFAIFVAFFSLSAVLGLIALVRKGKRRVHRGAATMVWLLMISFVMGGSTLTYVYSMVGFIARVDSQVEAHGPPPPAFDFLSPFQMRHMPGFSAVLWSYGILSVVMALLGLIFVFMPPARTQPPPLPGKL